MPLQAAFCSGDGHDKKVCRGVAWPADRLNEQRTRNKAGQLLSIPVPEGRTELQIPKRNWP